MRKKLIELFGGGFKNADARKLIPSNAAMRNSMMQNPMVTAQDLIKLNEGTDFGLGPLDMKKGGVS